MEGTSGGSAWSALVIWLVGGTDGVGGVMTVDTVGVFLVFSVVPAQVTGGAGPEAPGGLGGLAYRTKQKGRGSRCDGFRGPGGADLRLTQVRSLQGSGPRKACIRMASAPVKAAMAWLISCSFCFWAFPAPMTCA